MNRQHLNLFIQITPAVLSLAGTIGNASSLYILSRPKFLKESMFRYFMVNEIFGSICLLFTWIHYIPIIFELNVSSSYCKIVIYTAYVLYCSYPWIYVLNSVDRLISLKYPFKFQLRKKFKTQALMIGSILLVFTFSNVTYLVYEERGLINGTFLCSVNDRKIAIIITGVNFIFSNFISSCIIVTITCLLAHYLITQKQVIQEERSNFKREIQFIKCILTMDIWFIITTTPFAITDLLQYMLDPFILTTNTWQLIHNICILLVLVQTSSNFLVLLLCNKRLRQSYKAIFCKNKVTPIIRQPVGVRV